MEEACFAPQMCPHAYIDPANNLSPETIARFDRSREGALQVGNTMPNVFVHPTRVLDSQSLEADPSVSLNNVVDPSKPTVLVFGR